MDAKFNLRIMILRRVEASRSDTNEPQETWPEPPLGTRRFSCRRMILTAGEEIRQGVNLASSSLKLEIRGQNVDIKPTDHVKLVVGGKIYRITGDPVRNQRTTIIMLESVERLPT